MSGYDGGSHALRRGAALSVDRNLAVGGASGSNANNGSDVRRKSGGGANPNFNPTGWADKRRAMIERAERLREEQRVRMLAMGQLPPQCKDEVVVDQVPGGLGGGVPVVAAREAGGRRAQVGAAPGVPQRHIVAPPWAIEVDFGQQPQPLTSAPRPVGDAIALSAPGAAPYQWDDGPSVGVGLVGQAPVLARRPAPWEQDAGGDITAPVGGGRLCQQDESLGQQQLRQGSSFQEETSLQPEPAPAWNDGGDELQSSDQLLYPQQHECPPLLVQDVTVRAHVAENRSALEEQLPIVTRCPTSPPWAQRIQHPTGKPEGDQAYGDGCGDDPEVFSSTCAFGNPALCNDVDVKQLMSKAVCGARTRADMEVLLNQAKAVGACLDLEPKLASDDVLPMQHPVKDQQFGDQGAVGVASVGALSAPTYRSPGASRVRVGADVTPSSKDLTEMFDRAFCNEHDTKSSIGFGDHYTHGLRANAHAVSLSSDILADRTLLLPPSREQLIDESPDLGPGFGAEGTLDPRLGQLLPRLPPGLPRPPSKLPHVALFVPASAPEDPLPLGVEPLGPSPAAMSSELLRAEDVVVSVEHSRAADYRSEAEDQTIDGDGRSESVADMEAPPEYALAEDPPDFRVEIPSSCREVGELEADQTCKDWWANKSGPSWMRKLKPSIGQNSVLDKLDECGVVEQAAIGDGAMCPNDELLVSRRKQPELPSFSDAMQSGDEKSRENNAWLRNLRDVENDDFASDDPMVFGKPRPLPQRQKVKKRAKSENPSTDQALLGAHCQPRPDEPQSEEMKCWLGMLRDFRDADGDDDPLVFGKPQSQPLQSRKQQKRPPRPTRQDASGVDGPASSSVGFANPEAGRGRSKIDHTMCGGDDGGAELRTRSRGASENRPGSGYLNRNIVPVGQMPDALRKRLEKRAEQRGEARAERARDRLPIKTASEGQSPDAGSPAEEDDQVCVKLPPLRPEQGRRCCSQPPATHQVSDGKPSLKKKGKRPQSMGAGGIDDDGEKCGRQMFDKNTLRTMNRDLFAEYVSSYRKHWCRPTRGDRGDVSAQSGQDSRGMVEVFLRKRPMFAKEEQQRHDFDVVTILPGDPFSRKIVIHNCLFQADLKTPFISHLTFDFDRVFDEQASNEDVYEAAGFNLVRRALAGGVGTMFMFGQTGSGKTHTMTAIQDKAAHDLFVEADGVEPWLSIQFVELRGNRCFDLLAPGVGKLGSVRPELRLREQSDGSYVADGAADMFPKTPEELSMLMQMAQSRRATSATDANSVSSRSHAVCTLRLLHSDGQLLLVDCAGTERRKDSMYHSKERQQEGAEINASLHALKECIRHLTTSPGKVPSYAYRASSLTKVLADSFIRGSSASLAAVCTVAPCATDTEHTIATMRMGMSLGGKGAEKEEKELLDLSKHRKPRLVHPKAWTSDQVFEWLASVHGGQLVDLVDILPSNFTGQMLVRLSEGRCVQLCGNSEKRGRLLFDLLHQEIQRVEASRKAQ